MKEIRFFVTLCFPSEDGQRHATNHTDDEIKEMADKIANGIKKQAEEAGISPDGSDEAVKLVYVEEQFSGAKSIVNLD